MSTESNDRVLIGAATYIAGPYHFVKGFPQLVRETHIAYIDSLRTSEGEPMFSHVEQEHELEFIDGEDLDEVGLGELVDPADELAEELDDEPEQDPAVTASMDAMKSEGTPSQDPELVTDPELDPSQESTDEAQAPVKTGKVLKVGKQAPKAPEQKPEDDKIVTV